MRFEIGDSSRESIRAVDQFYHNAIRSNDIYILTRLITL